MSKLSGVKDIKNFSKCLGFISPHSKLPEDELNFDLLTFSLQC